MRLVSSMLAFGLASTINAVVIDMEGLPDTGLDTSSWTTGTAPPIASLVDLNDFQIAAKNTLSPANYAYYRTGALDEITYNNNMLNWRKIRLNGFSFVDVSNVNTKTSILGYQFNSPFFIAPAAQAGLANSGAETNLVKAAGAAGILYVPSISSTQSIETIASAAQPGQVLFHQEYIWSDMNRLQSELTRMENSSYKAIFLTVDNTGINGVRNRQMRFSGGGDAGHSATFTIAALNQLRNMTKLPIIPKGVKTAHDVKLCADLGFPAVYISNHGGRVVDLAPTAVEILLDVHRLYPDVFNKIEIYADGGVRRATHILTLLALGVRAVGIGRAPMFANLYGQAGVTQAINILQQELITEMALLGQSNVDGYRGNSTFINTRQIEVEYFGAPLGISLDSTPYAIPIKSGTVSTTSTTTASSTSLTSSSSSSSLSSSGSASSATSSSSASSSTTLLTSTTSTSAASTSAVATSTSTSSTASQSSSTVSTSSAQASSTPPVCPGSNSTTYIGASGRSFMIECGIDHQGGDLSSKSVSSFQACINLCDSTSGCVDVSLSGSACYLKKTLGKALTASGIQGAKLLS